MILNYTNHDMSGVTRSLELLPHSYQELDVRVEIYEDADQYLSKNLLRHRLFRSKEEQQMWETHLSTAKAFYSPDENRIYLFADKYPSIERTESPTRLLMVASLYHEMRHAFQHEHEPDFMKVDYIDPNQEGYATQPSEEDAESFAQNCMTMFHQELSDIHKTDFEWAYEGKGNLLIDF